jgi:hypothetical protein
VACEETGAALWRAHNTGNFSRGSRRGIQGGHGTAATPFTPLASLVQAKVDAMERCTVICSGSSILATTFR